MLRPLSGVNRFQKGVTLLEIILAIVIFSVTAAVALPYLGQAVENQRMQEAQRSLHTIADAIRVYDYEYSAAISSSCSDQPGSFLRQLDTRGIIKFRDETRNDLAKRFRYCYSVVGTVRTITAQRINPTGKTATYTMGIHRAADSCCSIS